jgi:hypothetical protein
VKAPGAEDKIPKHLKNIYLTNREDAKCAKEDRRDICRLEDVLANAKLSIGRADKW